ncbi:hypothetical protein PR048_012979 [Dryococelus australis]|uniref:NWD2 C-terminal beta-propeller domain-containing protein n=1 Tax=Dryococelus australis TaxID=614101 RepID=A0ABQ9HQX6_9NEOP|nr:hypothetical protein PR048_012979 [Dryococelus australis]
MVLKYEAPIESEKVLLARIMATFNKVRDIAVVFERDISALVPMPHKPNLLALIDSDKGSVLDIRSKRIVRTIPKWGGRCTRDGKYGLYAPSRASGIGAGAEEPPCCYVAQPPSWMSMTFYLNHEDL